MATDRQKKNEDKCKIYIGFTDYNAYLLSIFMYILHKLLTIFYIFFLILLKVKSKREKKNFFSFVNPFISFDNSINSRPTKSS